MHELAVGGDDVGADEVVAGEAVLAHQPADAAAEREAADAGRGDEAAGRREAVRLRLVVDVGPDRAAADVGDAGRDVDAHLAHRREVDDHAVVAGREPGDAVRRRRGPRAAGRCSARSRPPRSRPPRPRTARPAPAGRSSNIPFQMRHASAYPSSAGREDLAADCSRSSWTVASPITGEIVALIPGPPIFDRVAWEGVVRGRSLQPLSGDLRRPTARACNRRGAQPRRAASSIRSPAPRRTARRRLEIAARASATSAQRPSVWRDPAAAFGLAEHRQRLVEHGARPRRARPRTSSRSARPPERARKPPPVAGAPEQLARVLELALGLLVARRRPCRRSPRPVSAMPIAAAVVERAAQLERRAAARRARPRARPRRARGTRAARARSRGPRASTARQNGARPRRELARPRDVAARRARSRPG